ncbi:MAG: class I SAM-dependent methyltransferase [Candidatus Marinarcus sp.]|uniref:class I SAM-dependent methyltransferase n=1 Tax=Candidatus Marinarcus sp. TaxID=3100987 RepID=UPI003B00AFD8
MITQEYKELDGVKIFHENQKESHEDYKAKGLDKLYKQEEKHFWFIARKEFILQNIQQYTSKKEKVIEIGAGTGNVSRYLQKNGYENISVGEMHLNGLKYAQSYGMKNCYQFDLLDTPFENEFDAVCMFDVLEHIPDDNIALQNVHNMLTKGGEIVITVPSHMWLWNRDDARAGHKIRYIKKELVEKLEQNNFEVLTARYFFISITPLLFLRRILNKDDGRKVRDEEYNHDISMNTLLSKILLFISRIENKLNKFLPNWFGGSLFVIARKKN